MSSYTQCTQYECHAQYSLTDFALSQVDAAIAKWISNSADYTDPLHSYPSVPGFKAPSALNISSGSQLEVEWEYEEDSAIARDWYPCTFKNSSLGLSELVYDDSEEAVSICFCDADTLWDIACHVPRKWRRVQTAHGAQTPPSATSVTTPSISSSSEPPVSAPSSFPQTAAGPSTSSSTAPPVPVSVPSSFPQTAAGSTEGSNHREQTGITFHGIYHSADVHAQDGRLTRLRAKMGSDLTIVVLCLLEPKEYGAPALAHPPSGSFFLTVDLALKVAFDIIKQIKQKLPPAASMDIAFYVHDVRYTPHTDVPLYLHMCHLANHCPQLCPCSTPAKLQPLSESWLARMHSSTTVCQSTPSQHLDRRGQLLPATILFEPIFPLAIFVISLVNCKFLRTICSSPGACPQQRWLPTDGTLVVFQLYAHMITVRVSASCISVVALLKIQHALLGQHLTVERPFAHWLAMCWAPFLQSAASCLALTRHRL